MIRNLLLTGGPGPDHDFGASSCALAEALRGSSADAGPKIGTTIVSDPRIAFEMLAEAMRTEDGFDLFTVNALRWQMDADRYAAQRDDFAYALQPHDLDGVEALLQRGGGLVVVHTAVICFDGDLRWQRIVGATWNWSRSSHPSRCALRVTPTNAAHPITNGIDAFQVDDELYQYLDVESGAVPLLQANVVGVEGLVQPAPVLWARPYGAGRVVTHLLGHDAESIAHAQHRRVLRRSALWAIGATKYESTGPDTAWKSEVL